MTPEEKQEQERRACIRLRWTRALNEAYRESTGLNALPHADHDAILDAFIEHLDACALPKMRAFYATRPHLIDRIRERAVKDVFWRQSVVLCVYLWVQASPGRAKRLWPLTPKELEPFFMDLGIAFRDPL